MSRLSSYLFFLGNIKLGCEYCIIFYILESWMFMKFSRWGFVSRVFLKALFNTPNSLLSLPTLTLLIYIQPLQLFNITWRRGADVINIMEGYFFNYNLIYFALFWLNLWRMYKLFIYIYFISVSLPGGVELLYPH